MSRQCGNCTKCCEGYLAGNAYGKPFYPGRPCHFISIGKGCSIYAKRPKDPCVSYQCVWLSNSDVPEWMKPDVINTIITLRKFPDRPIEYWDVIEAGEKLDARVLSWLIMHALSNGINLRWMIDGGAQWIGSQEFLDAMQEQNNK